MPGATCAHVPIWDGFRAGVTRVTAAFARDGAGVAGPPRARQTPDRFSFRHHGDVALRTKVQAWLTPEAQWARARNGVIRHPLRHVLLLALSCGSLCIS